MCPQPEHVRRRVTSTPTRPRRLALRALLTGAIGVVAVLPGAVSAAPSANRVHIVKSGENLYRIALDERVSLDALLQANGLKLDSLIVPGQQLVVPGAGQPAPQPAAAPATPPVQVTTSSTIYIVKSGDGLFQIAQKLGVSIDDLLALNNLKLTSLIVPGQPLKVPATSKGLSATVPSAAQQPAKRGGAAAGPGGAHAAVQAPSAKGSAVAAFAQSQLGKPYRFAASGPDAYDCSGLVVAAFRSIGVKLPHHSSTQATYGTPVDWRTSPILPGDLVFTHSSSGGNLSHVGIAVDGNRYIHSPRSNDVVKSMPMPSPNVIQAVRRIVSG